MGRCACTLGFRSGCISACYVRYGPRNPSAGRWLRPTSWYATTGCAPKRLPWPRYTYVHVVERVLFRKRPTGSLRVGTQRHGFRVFRTKAFHDFAHSKRAARILAISMKCSCQWPKRKTNEARMRRCRFRCSLRAQVVHTVGQCVGQLDVRRGTGFLHVVTGDGNGVELRHLL